MRRSPAGSRGLTPPGTGRSPAFARRRSEEHTSELQSHSDLVCRLLLEKKKKKHARTKDPAPTKRAGFPAGPLEGRRSIIHAQHVHFVSGSEGHTESHTTVVNTGDLLSR